MKLYLDEAIFARTAANCSFRNAVERMHAIANLGLQSVGIMRKCMPENFEKKLKKYGGNVEIRTACEADSNLLSHTIDSLKQPKRMIETVLSQLSLKGVPFKIYHPASDDDITSFADTLNVIDSNMDTLIAKKDLSKFSKFKEFFDTHCVSRTYYFHVKKCEDPQCIFHQPKQLSQEIERFPYPIPYTDKDGVERFKEGTDDDEKFLTSRLVDVTKNPHGLPFSPTTQTAKNVSKFVKCSECQKPRVLYAEKKLKLDDQSKLQRVLKKHIYICGTSFIDFTKNPIAFVRENLSCATAIETSYYGVNFPDVCLYCGSEKKLLAKDSTLFPQCRRYQGDRQQRRKRKVTAEKLRDAKKKK